MVSDKHGNTLLGQFSNFGLKLFYRMRAYGRKWLIKQK